MKVTIRVTPMCNKNIIAKTFECDEIKGGVHGWFDKQDKDSDYPNENVEGFMQFHNSETGAWSYYEHWQIISVKIEE